MSAAHAALADKPVEVVYPDSDGELMADNTAQAEWMTVLYGNLDAILPDFVAMDHLWYPAQGDNKTRQAPDVMVALGRPKGYRGSYRQWEEDGVAPQVVFEILSPGNSLPEMYRKLLFYQRYGVEEYYVYDPDGNVLSVYVRNGAQLVETEASESWTSPLLGVRFLLGESLEIYGPDGKPFMTFAETKQRLDDAERRIAEVSARAEAEHQRAEALAAKLRALGIDPDAV